jgi:hypothetical protein
MRFTSLRIRSFRVVENFEVSSLSDFVLIAGPNGCGKSCVFDAVAPVERFSPGAAVTMSAGSAHVSQDRSGDDWVSRRVTSNGVVSVAWQQVCVGAHYAGARCDIHVDGDLLRFFVGDDRNTVRHHPKPKRQASTEVIQPMGAT